MVCAINDQEWLDGMAALNDAVEHGAFKGQEGERITMATLTWLKTRAVKVITLAMEVGKLPLGYLERWAVVVGPHVVGGDSDPTRLAITLIPVK